MIESAQRSRQTWVFNSDRLCRVRRGRINSDPARHSAINGLILYYFQISKAAMLQKGAEYIKQLKAERNQIKEEMESLRQQIECLNNSIA